MADNDVGRRILDDLFGSLYLTNLEDAKLFVGKGVAYHPPEKFLYGEWYHVATVVKHGGVGQPVEIDECRMPARFYRLRALASENSIGEPKPAWQMSTGSGSEMAQLVVKIAQAVAQGMLGLREEGDT